MFDKIKFAQIIKNIKECYDSQEEFAKKSGIGRTYLSQYMNIKLDKPPKPSILEKLANASKGITNYGELMYCCGYIGTPQTAAYEFASDNDKSIIDSAVSYAFSNKLNASSIYKNEYINGLLKNLNSISINNALNQISIEVAKGELIYGINNVTADTNVFPVVDTPIKVPVVGKIAAGLPILAVENIEGYEFAPSSYIKDGYDYFYLRVQGDSMNLKFNDGDIVLVQKQAYLENDEIGVILVNGDDATVKKYKAENGLIILEPMSTNPKNTVQIYDPKRINIKIVGKVISYQGKV